MLAAEMLQIKNFRKGNRGVKFQIVRYLMWTQCFMLQEIPKSLLNPQKLGNRSCKNKWIHFSKQFQKRYKKLGTKKLPSEASQPIYKWCWFSSMMPSCIFYIQSISYILIVDVSIIYIYIYIIYIYNIYIIYIYMCVCI